MQNPSFTYTTAGCYSVTLTASNACGSSTVTETDLVCCIANDDCANAIPIMDGINGPYTNIGSSNDPIAWPCALGGSDVWFTYTATCTGAVTFDTCSPVTNYDSAIEVFNSDCTNLLSLGCNDDSCGLQSSISVPAMAGDVFNVRVGGFNSATGNFEINVSCAVAPGNDTCGGAVVVVDGLNPGLSNSGASTSTPANSCVTGAGADVWYTYTASCAGLVVASTVNQTFSTAVEIYSGSCGALTSIGCGFGSATSTAVNAGDVLLIAVSGAGGATGMFDLDITCRTPNTNDECANAIALVAGANGPFDNLSSSTSTPAWPCALGGNDVWFSFTPVCDGTYSFQTCGTSSYDTCLELFDGGCGALNPIVCNDDSCGLQSEVSAPMMAGVTYHLRVGGFNGATGTFGVEVSRAGGSGTFSSVFPGCGTTAITTTGNPDIGTTVTYSIAPVQSVGIMWIGAIQLGTPLCVAPVTCTLGTTLDFLVSGDTIVGNIPCDPALVGGTLYTQGADIGALGGCPAAVLGVPFELSDTIATTIGS